MDTKPDQMPAMMTMLRALRLAAALLIGGVGLVNLVDLGLAQDVDCEAMRQQMAAIARPDANRDARFARAIDQQRSELARTQAYADQIGCGGFNLFGSAAPQCDAIENRISRMQNNLDALDAQAHALRNGDPDRTQDLAARYDAYCRTRTDDQTMVYNDPGLMPDDGSGDLGGDQSGEDREAQGGGKAICVRTCDGGFFPLATSVRNGDLDGLQALCTAQCPNTEAKLYTTGDTDDISGAMSLDGRPYTALPAAFKFQKTHEASCTCKPPGQSWVEALARAEELLDKSQGHDVTVTEKMSAEMARPSVASPGPAKKPGKRDRKSVAAEPVPALDAAGISRRVQTSAPTP